MTTGADSSSRKPKSHEQADDAVRRVPGGDAGLPPDADIADQRVRGGWASMEKELRLYREALLMFYAKAAVYLRALGKSLPEVWIDWMG